MSDFKPLLAGTVDDVLALRFPLIASPKLDGIRAVVIDGVLLSRNLKPIPNVYVQRMFGKKIFSNLDGELIFGSPTSTTCFRDTSSAVMSYEGSPDVHFYVFDTFGNPETPYRTRLAKIHHMAGRDNLPIVQSRVVETALELRAWEERWLAAGFEGVMLRDPDGPYKFGRSTLREHILLKLKRFADGEAVILGVKEQMHNANAAKTDALGRTERSSKKEGLKGKRTLGAFRVKDLKTGAEFDIGTGLDDELRQHLWNSYLANKGHPPYFNQLIKYRYFPTGSKEKPRFPVFVGFRDPIDL